MKKGAARFTGSELHRHVAVKQIVPQRRRGGGRRWGRRAGAPVVSYLAPGESADEKVVTLNFTSWNQMDGWVRSLDTLRRAA